MGLQQKADFLQEQYEKKMVRTRKQRERQAKQNAAREKIRREREEAAAAEKAKQQEIARKTREKKQVPAQIRKLCISSHFKDVTAKAIDTVCFHASIEDIKTVLACTEGGAAQLAVFEGILKAAKGVKKELKRAEKERKKEAEAAKERKSGAVWSDAQLALLVNAVGRFPGGTQQRWEKIQKVVGRERTTDEIIAKVKELTKKSKYKNKRKKQKEKEKEKVKEKEKEKKVESVEDKEEVWTKEQQTALEGALRAVRTLPATEKWDKVEEMVPGKTKKQCVERFKWIRAQLV